MLKQGKNQTNSRSQDDVTINLLHSVDEVLLWEKPEVHQDATKPLGLQVHGGLSAVPRCDPMSLVSIITYEVASCCTRVRICSRNPLSVLFRENGL